MYWHGFNKNDQKDQTFNGPNSVVLFFNCQGQLSHWQVGMTVNWHYKIEEENLRKKKKISGANYKFIQGKDNFSYDIPIL